MTTVYISPPQGQIQTNNGIGRIIHAQHAMLPPLGIRIVSDPRKADVIACHIEQGDMPRVDVLHCHGLYWTADEGGEYAAWHHDANTRIASAARRAIEITVPSEWVAMPFKRDMRRAPRVIGHGIESTWAQGTNLGYILWNKNRPTDVCDPTPALFLAQRGFDVVSTFAPIGKEDARPDRMRLTGAIPHAEMQALIQNADLYLATTKETFGIGTIEAMASGVPVLGYAWGGTADIVTHKVNGYLARPGDIDDLARGVEWLRANRAQVSEAAIRAAARYTWDAVMPQYAALYKEVALYRRRESRSVTVVVTSYNYGKYVGEALDSLLAQTQAPAEVIVVDDGSTDNTAEVVAAYPQVRLIQQSNQGVAAARNRGISEATQEYIVCLDADDKLDPRFIAACKKTLDADRGIGIAYTGLMMFSGDHAPRLSPWPPSSFSWEDQAKVANPPSNYIPSACMFRRQMWERAGGYQQIWAPGEDAEFWTRGLSIGYAAQSASPEGLFWYRTHAGSASRVRKYRRVDTWHPWMRDGKFPFAVPAKNAPRVRSYSDPLVAVIIPVGKGHWGYVASALDSLLGQTAREWCAILVNDSGEQVPRGILTTYPFVHIIDTGGNHGPGKARNDGIARALATGTPFVLFLDADDYLLPDALAIMLEGYVASEGRYVYTDWVAITENEQRIHQTPEYDQIGWLRKGLHAVTVLMETSQASQVGFDESLTGWEDWDFFIKCAAQGFCGVRVPEPLIGYRMHSGRRREESLQQKGRLLEILQSRYAAYSVGGTEMVSCCGGNGGNILKAKRAIGLPAQASASGDETRSVAPAAGGLVRMEYIGSNQGAIAYKVNGRVYAGGKNEFDRWHNMPEDDAQALEKYPQWKRAGKPSPVIAENRHSEFDAPIVPTGGYTGRG